MTMLPYELIGKVSVAILTLLLLVLLSIGLFAATIYVWTRFWSKVTRIMLHGYDATDPEPKRPPLWREKFGLFSFYLSRTNFDYALAVYLNNYNDDNEEDFVSWYTEEILKSDD